jgi:hypothetical protein
MQIGKYGFAAVLACAFFSGSAFAVNLPSVLSTQVITSPVEGDRAGEGLAVLDVTGIPSMDTLGSPNNRVVYLWVGPFNFVTGMGWDVVLQTVAPESRRSDIKMLITNTAFLPLPNFGISPGFADRTPGGPTAYSNNIDKFADLSLPDVWAQSDGLIRLEFFDTPDHAAGLIDGLWVSGNIYFQTLNPIPDIPASGASCLLTFACIALRRRARKQT